MSIIQFSTSTVPPWWHDEPEEAATMRYSVDPKSRELAEYFLPDGAPENVKRELAQAIQDAVEGYLLTAEERDECSQEIQLGEKHGT